MPVIYRSTLGFALALASVVLLRADPLPAQLPFAMEVRGGVALPAEAFEGAEGGQAGEVSATWQVLPLAGVYGAYQSNRFAWDAGGHATDDGFAAGVRITLPALLIPVDPWVRGGVVVHQLKTETRAAESGVGYEVGAGLGFPLARGITLTPGVLWTRYRDGELLRVRHLRADAGLRMRF